MADDGGKPAEIAGKDPKKRKMVAVGIGLAALLIIYMLYKSRSGSASAAASGTPSTGTGGVTADVAVPSGDVSASDLMSQFASTTQASQAQELQALASMMHGQGVSQPGGPPLTAIPAVAGQSGGFWYKTTSPQEYSTGIAMNAYGLSQSDPWFAENDSTGSTVVRSANPGIDWSKALPAGTEVYIPAQPGPLGKTPTLAANESYTNPTGYVPPPLSTNYMSSWPSIWQTQPGVVNSGLLLPGQVVTPAQNTQGVVPQTG